MRGWLEKQNVVQMWLLANPEAREGQVPAQAFFRACMALATIFDLISGMSLAKGAMVNSLVACAVRFPISDETRTVNQGVVDEAERLGGAAAMADQTSLIHQLTWLLRRVAFARGILHELLHEPGASTAACVRRAYETSLKEHQSRAVQGAVWLLAKAAPKRAQLESLLAAEGLKEQLAELLPAVDRVTRPVQQALDDATR